MVAVSTVPAAARARAARRGASSDLRSSRPISRHAPGAGRSVSLRELDLPLGPVLVSSVGSPSARVLAVLAYALPTGVSAGRTRLWLASRGPDDVAAIVSSPYTFGRLARSARRYQDSLSTPDGRAAARNRVAVRLVARLLVPVELPAGWTVRRMTSARTALLIVGASILRSMRDPETDERAWETAQVSHAWLAVRMGATAQASGVSRAAARRAVDSCVELGWLRQVSNRPGHPGRYKLDRLPGPVGEEAWRYSEVVDQLAGLDRAAGGPADLERVGPDHDDDLDRSDLEQVPLELAPDAVRAAALIRSAAHPAWAHSRPGHAGLLVALADAAGANPVQALGMTKRYVVKVREELRIAGLNGDTEDLVAALNTHGRATGAMDLFAAAERARLEAVNTTQAGRTVARAAKSTAYWILQAADPSPTLDDAEAITAWRRRVLRATAAVLRDNAGPGWAGETEPLRDELAKAVVGRSGLPAEAALPFATKVVETVAMTS